MTKNEIIKKAKKDFASQGFVRFMYDGFDFYIEPGMQADFNFDISNIETNEIVDGGMYDGSIDQCLNYITSDLDYLKDI